MKHLIAIFLSVFLTSQLFAQVASVTNVTAAQRTDGSKIVDIYYDLSEDTLFTYFTVIVEISMDGGSTFSQSSYVNGDVGNGIISGLNKHVEWNIGAEFYGTFNDQTVIRIIATGRFFNVSFPFSVVSAGDFTYGSSNEIRNIPYDYEMMMYEATNADYAAFLIDAFESGGVWLDGDYVQGFYSGDEVYGPGNYNLIQLSGSHIYWNGTTFVVHEGYGQHPVAFVSWFGAYKFADYYALRLPTDEEWEKAARGNTGNAYPWGNSIDGTYANYWDSGDPYDNGTSPVGFYDGNVNDGFSTNNSQSPYGIYDLAGNVSEWTSTWSSSNSDRKIFKGGAWAWGSGEASSVWWADWWSIWDCDQASGFRCVRTISSARADYLLGNKSKNSKLK